MHVDSCRQSEGSRFESLRRACWWIFVNIIKIRKETLNQEKKVLDHSMGKGGNRFNRDIADQGSI